MTTLLQHAKAELRAAGMFDADADYDGQVAPCITSMMEVFSAYRHSGGSKEQTIAVFDKLVRGMPLSPLTGEDDEWEKPEGAQSDQILINKRCHRVFKDADMAWDVDLGRKPLVFPYTPQ